jgi:hypothetical protein
MADIRQIEQELHQANEQNRSFHAESLQKDSDYEIRHKQEVKN